MLISGASARGGIRTPDARLRTAALYPLSYTGTSPDASTFERRFELSAPGSWCRISGWRGVAQSG